MKITVKYIDLKLRTLLKIQPVMILEMSLQTVSSAAQWYSWSGTCFWHHGLSQGQAKLLRKDPRWRHFWLYFRLRRSPISKPQTG